LLQLLLHLLQHLMAQPSQRLTSQQQVHLTMLLTLQQMLLTRLPMLLTLQQTLLTQLLTQQMLQHRLHKMQATRLMLLLQL